MKRFDLVVNPYVAKYRNGKPNPLHTTLFLRRCNGNDIECITFNGDIYTFVDAYEWEVVGNANLKQFILKEFYGVEK